MGRLFFARETAKRKRKKGKSPSSSLDDEHPARRNVTDRHGRMSGGGEGALYASSIFCRESGLDFPSVARGEKKES